MRTVGITYGTEGAAKAPAPAPAKTAPKKSRRPTKAELVAEAEDLGVEVPEGATNPQIAKLIDEAKKEA